MLRIFTAAALFAVAGCVPGPRGVPQPERPPVGPPPSTPTRPPIQPGIPDDTAHHRVALLVPLTGPNAGVGNSLANATQLALLDTRNDQVRITTYDTAQGAAAAAQKALAEGNRLILGPLLAEDVRAVMPIARAAHVPVLSFSNDVSVAGNGAYLLGYTPQQSIERVVDYARGTGITDFVGLIPAGLYGERASTAFLRAVEAAGGRVLALGTFDRSQASINAALAKIDQSPFQAVLIASSASTAGTLVPLVRRNGGAQARVLGTELWNSDSNVASNAALAGAWFASVSDGHYRQYAAKYRARFGVAPYRLSTLGYDAVLLTVRIARDWKAGASFPANMLTDPDGFAGLDGAFRFGRDGVAERALEVQEIRGGQTVTISPAPTRFGN